MDARTALLLVGWLVGVSRLTIKWSFRYPRTHPSTSFCSPCPRFFRCWNTLRNVALTHTHPSGNPVAEAETQAWGEYYQDYLAPGEEAIEPMSDVAYPIIQGMATRVAAAGADGYDPANHTAVGIIVATMYWRSLIHNILPQGSNGIQVVFKMCSDDFFTYQIQGPAVVYDGVGDFHNKKYDSLALNVTLNDLGNFSTMRNAGYSGAPLISDFCNFTIQLYPSDVMKAAYTTNNPIIFTIVAIVIFAFTSLVFFLYDIMVERRQDTVMKTAVRSTAIVSSLFPSDVRDRIYPSPADKQPSGNTPQKFTLPENAAFGEGDKSVQPSPIAEMYPDTTVMFADIAGFTQWSSTRQPTQVFHLLESLYAVFDEIAKQRGVFKVETIGDCYLAVVGLPTPRKAHAIASVRFAAECRDAMQRLTVELEDTLGQVRCESVPLFTQSLHPPFVRP